MLIFATHSVWRHDMIFASVLQKQSMEKHPQHTGNPRPLNDRVSQVPGRHKDQPGSSSDEDHPESSHEGDTGSLQHKGQPRPSHGEDHPGSPRHAQRPEPPKREGVAHKDRKKIRDKGAKEVEDEPEVREDKPNRADFHHGSTTQGGSDYGQGSHDIPDNENRQGSESNDGSNYDHERGWKNEALRREDID